MSLTFDRPGNGVDPWAALAPHATGWCAVWSHPGWVRFELADGYTTSRKVPTDFLRYLDAAGDGGTEVVAVGVGADDHAYLVRLSTAGVQDLGTVYGNFPVAVAWGAGLWIALVLPDQQGRTYRVINLVGEAQDYATPFADGTTQGIRQYFGNQLVVWGDHTHVRTVAGRTIHKYSDLGPAVIWAGQRNGPDHIDLYDGQAWFTAIPGSAQPPRLTYLPQSKVGVAALTSHGASFAIGPPWPALIPDGSTPPPPPPPPPPDPPEDAMLPDLVKTTIRAFVAVFPLPDIGEANPQDPAVIGPHEDRCRDWMRRLAEQLTFSHPAEGFGRKRADPTRPWSKDNLPRMKAGVFEGWDLMLGAGTGHPTLNLDGHAESLAGQYFEPVLAVNHLGTPPPPPPPPPLEPHPYDGGEHDTGTCDVCGRPKADPIHTGTPPPPPPSDLVARVAALEAEGVFLRESIALLIEQREADRVRLVALEAQIGQGVVKKGDPIAVSGVVGLTAVLRGQSVTLRGTI